MARRTARPRTQPQRVQSISVSSPKLIGPLGTIRVQYFWNPQPVAYRVVATQWSASNTGQQSNWPSLAARIATRTVLVADDNEHVGYLLDGARKVSRILSFQTEGAQRLADDYATALRARDLRKLHELTDIAEQLLTAPPPPPARNALPRDEIRYAATLLKHQGHDEQADAVADLAGRLDTLAVRDQETARQAAVAIRDAFAHLDRIPQDLRDVPGPDGTTPRQDALSVVDDAVGLLSRARAVAANQDANALRALRRYSGQWKHEDNPLNLE